MLRFLLLNFMVVVMRLIAQDTDHSYVHETTHKHRRSHHERKHV